MYSNWFLNDRICRRVWIIKLTDLVLHQASVEVNQEPSGELDTWSVAV